MDAVHVGTDVIFSDEIGFERAFGLSAQGTPLVRPDGMVAWRYVNIPADPNGTLSGIVAREAVLSARDHSLGRTICLAQERQEAVGG